MRLWRRTCRDGVEGALRDKRSLGVWVEAAADAQTDCDADGSNEDEGGGHQSMFKPAVACHHKGPAQRQALKPLCTGSDHPCASAFSGYTPMHKWR